MSPFTPSACRYPLRLRRSRAYSMRREGAAFSTIRRAYGLGVREVAKGWDVRCSRITRLERGGYRFCHPSDLDAALRQLWYWAVEKKYPGLAR